MDSFAFMACIAFMAFIASMAWIVFMACIAFMDSIAFMAFMASMAWIVFMDSIAFMDSFAFMACIAFMAFISSMAWIVMSFIAFMAISTLGAHRLHLLHGLLLDDLHLLLGPLGALHRLHGLDLDALLPVLVHLDRGELAPSMLGHIAAPLDLARRRQGRSKTMEGSP